MRFERTLGWVVGLLLAAGLAPSVSEAASTGSLINLTPAGNAISSEPAVSADGTTIVFSSSASNLTGGDANGHRDVFVWEQLIGITNVTWGANGASSRPGVSGDGSTIVFVSSASNLTGDPDNGFDDVFMWDQTSGIRNLTSGANGASSQPTISGNGSTVVFLSAASNLTGDPDNGFDDVFVWDQTSGIRNLTSSANGASSQPTISGDGSTVVFVSAASNLTGDPDTGATDVFLWDQANGITNLTLGVYAIRPYFRTSTSADGSVVVFTAGAIHIPDQWVWERASGISHLTTGSNGVVSADGSTIAFERGYEPETVWVWDQVNGFTNLTAGGVATSAFGQAGSPSVSADGSEVVFTSKYVNLTGDPDNGVWDVFAWERAQVAPDRLTVLATPCALHDSTAADGSFRGPLPANATRTVQVSGTLPTAQGGSAAECVPAGASAAVFTISALDPSGSGNLRLSESGVVANGGVVNYSANGLNNANTVTVPLSAGGAVDVFANAAATGVRLVALGYYSTLGTLRYTALTPCVVADSRTSTFNPAWGAFAGPHTAGAPYPDIDVVGTFPAAQGGNPAGTDCGVPVGADAIAINLVAVGSTGGSGFLAASSAGLDPSEPATPFADIGLNNATSVLVPLNGGEKISVDIEGVVGTPTTHVRVIVLGYLDGVDGSDYTPVNACAAFDTRATGLPGEATGDFLGKRLAGTATNYQVSGFIPAAQGGAGGDCGVPAGATAVLVNLVAIQPTSAGNFRAYARWSSPTGGVLNFSPLTPQMNNSNAVVIPHSSYLSLFTNTETNDGSPTVHARGVILGYYR